LSPRSGRVVCSGLSPLCASAGRTIASRRTASSDGHRVGA
jgi:hypothetical protein